MLSFNRINLHTTLILEAACQKLRNVSQMGGKGNHENIKHESGLIVLSLFCVFVSIGL